MRGKRRFRERVLACLMSFAMVLGMLDGFALTAKAAEDSWQVEWEGMTGEAQTFDTYEEVVTFIDTTANDSSRDYKITWKNGELADDDRMFTITSMPTQAASLTFDAEEVRSTGYMPVFDVNGAGSAERIAVPVTFAQMPQFRGGAKLTKVTSTSRNTRFPGSADIEELICGEGTSADFWGESADIHIGTLTIGRGGSIYVTEENTLVIDELKQINPAEIGTVISWKGDRDIDDEDTRLTLLTTKTDLTNPSVFHYTFGSGGTNAIEEVKDNGNGTWSLVAKKNVVKYFQLSYGGKKEQYETTDQMLQRMNELNSDTNDYVINAIGYDRDVTDIYSFNGLPQKARSVTFGKALETNEIVSYHLAVGGTGESISYPVIIENSMSCSGSTTGQTFDDLRIRGDHVYLGLSDNLTVGNLTAENGAGIGIATRGTLSSGNFTYGRLTVNGTLTGTVHFSDLPGDYIKVGDVVLTGKGLTEDNAVVDYSRFYYVLELVDNGDETQSFKVAEDAAHADDAILGAAPEGLRWDGFTAKWTDNPRIYWYRVSVMNKTTGDYPDGLNFDDVRENGECTHYCYNLFDETGDYVFQVQPYLAYDSGTSGKTHYLQNAQCSAYSEVKHYVRPNVALDTPVITLGEKLSTMTFNAVEGAIGYEITLHYDDGNVVNPTGNMSLWADGIGTSSYPSMAKWADEDHNSIFVDFGSWTDNHYDLTTNNAWWTVRAISGNPDVIANSERAKSKTLLGNGNPTDIIWDKGILKWKISGEVNPDDRFRISVYYTSNVSSTDDSDAREKTSFSVEIANLGRDGEYYCYDFSDDIQDSGKYFCLLRFKAAGGEEGKPYRSEDKIYTKPADTIGKSEITLDPSVQSALFFKHLENAGSYDIELYHVNDEGEEDYFMTGIWGLRPETLPDSGRRCWADAEHTMIYYEDTAFGQYKRELIVGDKYCWKVRGFSSDVDTWAHGDWSRSDDFVYTGKVGEDENGKYNAPTDVKLEGNWNVSFRCHAKGFPIVVVEIYKDGTWYREAGFYSCRLGLKDFCDVSEDIRESGEYSFRIKIKPEGGDTTHSESDWVEAGVRTYTKPSQTIGTTTPRWDSTRPGVVVFDSVPGASRYYVYCYKLNEDGSLGSGVYSEPPKGELEWDYSDWIAGQGAGKYKARVVARSGNIDVYANGEEDEGPLSEEYEYDAGATGPVDPGEKTYQVTYDYRENGTNHTIDVNVGSKLAEPVVNDLKGLVFEGWYKDSGFNTKWNFDTDTVTSNVTLYAKWTEVDTFKVTYDLQGHGEAIAEKTVNVGAKLTAPTTPTAEGFTFGGWYKEKECTTEWKFDTDTVTIDTTLYAKWTEAAPVIVTYTATFNLQGHGEAITPATVQAGGKVAEPVAPVAAGFVFGGWFKEAACTTAWDFANDTVAADTVLYAKWTEDKSTVTPEDVDDSSYKKEERIQLSTIGAAIGTIKPKVYDGNAYMPTVKVTATVDGKNAVLIEGIDYRVLYKDNVNAGTGKVIVKGNGIYDGEITADLTITKKPMNKLKVAAGGMGLNSTAEPPIYVYDGTRQLTLGVDYKLDGISGLTSSAGKKDVTVSATESSNYSGNCKTKVIVYATDKVLNDSDVTLEYTSKDYTGKALKPNVTVKFDGKELDKKSFSVKYTNNKEAGTAYVTVTGKKDYAGCVVKTFEIKPVAKSFELKKPISPVTYNGKYQKPKATVTVDGKALKAGKDYLLFYSNNLHATKEGGSKAKVTVKGLGNYAGTADKSFEFTINPQKINKVSVKGTKEKLEVTYLKRPLQKDIDYTVEPGEEAKGKIALTITGKGDFTGGMVKKVKVQ